MNVVFEGINGTGKTSIIKELSKIMKQEGLNVHCISEIDNKSPLAKVLQEMYNRDTFLRMKESISTIITESLILAADYHYMKEYTKGLAGYKIYDRDIFTQIVYQKYFLDREYGENNEFFSAWESCLMFDKKNIDVVIYVEAPFEICIQRTCERDNVSFSDSDRKILTELYRLQKEFVVSYCENNQINLVCLDGTEHLEKNARKVYEILIDLKGKEDKNDK